MKAHVIIAAALLSATAVLAAETNPAPQPQTQSPGGMMGRNMMAQGGMMGPGTVMPQGGMMGGGAAMMGMMQSAEGWCGAMGGMATIDRVEGRIAFLKTELKITDPQNDAWNAFAETLRANAKRLGELRASMPSQTGTASLGDRLEWQEKWLTARADDTKAIRTTYNDLAAKLTDEQKTTAEQILAPHLGMTAGLGGCQFGPAGRGMGSMNFEQMPGYRMMQGGAAPK